jgi:TonB family protein
MMKSLQRLFPVIFMVLVCSNNSGALQILQEPSTAIETLQRNAERGNPGAQVSLGTMYIQGTEVPQNYEEAAKWYRKAAEQGNRLAQSLLGSMCAEGLGVKQDFVEAYMWLTLASTGSMDAQNPFFQKAAEVRLSLAPKMTPQQMEESLKRVREWKPLRMQSPMPVDTIMLESRLIRKVEPIYPELAKRARVMGRVVLKITVDEAGNVSDIRVSSGHPLLNEAAVNAVSQWKYSPMLLNGEPVPVIASVTVLFNLK